MAGTASRYVHVPETAPHEQSSVPSGASPETHISTAADSSKNAPAPQALRDPEPERVRRPRPEDARAGRGLTFDPLEIPPYLRVVRSVLTSTILRWETVALLAIVGAGVGLSQASRATDAGAPGFAWAWYLWIVAHLGLLGWWCRTWGQDAFGALRRFSMSPGLLAALAMSAVALGSTLSVIYSVNGDGTVPSVLVLVESVLVALFLALRLDILRVSREHLARVLELSMHVPGVRYRVVDLDRMPHAECNLAELEPSTERLVPVEGLRAGNLLVVSAGEVVPADAEVLAGFAEVFERRWSLAAAPVSKNASSTVFAGTTIGSGYLLVRLLNQPEDAILHGVSGAATETAQAARLFEGLGSRLKWWTGLAVFLGAETGVYWWRETHALDLALVVGGASAIAAFWADIPLLMGALDRSLIATAFRGGMLIKDVGSANRLKSIRSIVVDRAGLDASSMAQIEQVELMDDRFDLAALEASLMVLCEHTEDKELRAVAAALRERTSATGVVAVGNVQYFPGLGVIGSAGRAEFSLGSEEFLIARGVQLQAADTLYYSRATSAAQPQSDDTTAPSRPYEHARELFLAVNEDAVVRIRYMLVPGALTTAHRDELGRIGVGLILCEGQSDVRRGDHAPRIGDLDSIAGQLELERGYVFRNLSPQEYRARLENQAPALWYSTGTATPAPRAAADGTGHTVPTGIITVGDFDPLIWNINEFDVTLMRAPVARLTTLLQIAHRLAVVRTETLILTLVVSGVLFAGAATGMLAGWFVAASTLTICVLLWANFFARLHLRGD